MFSILCRNKTFTEPEAYGEVFYQRKFERIWNLLALDIGICNPAILSSHYKCLYSFLADCKSARTGCFPLPLKGFGGLQHRQAILPTSQATALRPHNDCLSAPKLLPFRATTTALWTGKAVVPKHRAKASALRSYADGSFSSTKSTLVTTM